MTTSNVRFSAGVQGPSRATLPAFTAAHKPSRSDQKLSIVVHKLSEGGHKLTSAGHKLSSGSHKLTSADHKLGDVPSVVEKRKWRSPQSERLGIGKERKDRHGEESQEEGRRESSS